MKILISKNGKVHILSIIELLNEFIRFYYGMETISLLIFEVYESL